MQKIEFYKIDETKIRINSDTEILKEVKDYFTFKAPNYKFHPKFKARLWDGNISLFDTRTGTLPIGLFKRLKDFAIESKYDLQFIQNKQYPEWVDETNQEKIDIADFDEFIQHLNPYSKDGPITIRDYQYDAVYKAISDKKITLLSPTSSGKSLIIYAVIRWILEQDPDNRIVLIVPNIQLVNQMFGDFTEYSSMNGFNVDANCQRLYSGQSKELSKRILITTWQSFTKLSKSADSFKFMQLYKGVIVDECHLASGKEIQSILSKCTNAVYRVGTTGTIDQSASAKVNLLQIEGYLGPVHKVISTRELMDNGQVSNLQIKTLVLKYSDASRELMKKAEYQDEINWLIENKARNDFIIKLALVSKGTTLILVRKRDDHAKKLFTQLKEKSKRNVYYIAGDVNGDVRESIRKLANIEDCVIIATLATMSTGVSIPNLRNIIFGSPNKSMVSVLQSIGRSLRLHKDKDIATVYDIIDDLCYKKRENYSYQHGVERLAIYRKEKYEFTLKEIPFNDT